MKRSLKFIIFTTVFIISLTILTGCATPKSQNKIDNQVQLPKISEQPLQLEGTEQNQESVIDETEEDDEIRGDSHLKK